MLDENKQERLDKLNKRYSFKNFYQFERALPDMLMKINQDSPTATSVYMLLIRASNHYGACSVPESRIAKVIGKSPRTVNRAIKYLARNRYIAVAHNGRANVYVTNYNLVWGAQNYKKGVMLQTVTFPTSVTIINDKNNKKFFARLRAFLNNDVTRSVHINSNGEVATSYRRNQPRGSNGRFSNSNQINLFRNMAKRKQKSQLKRNKQAD